MYICCSCESRNAKYYSTCKICHHYSCNNCTAIADALNKHGAALQSPTQAQLYDLNHISLQQRYDDDGDYEWIAAFQSPDIEQRSFGLIVANRSVADEDRWGEERGEGPVEKKVRFWERMSKEGADSVDVKMTSHIEGKGMALVDDQEGERPGKTKKADHAVRPKRMLPAPLTPKHKSPRKFVVPRSPLPQRKRTKQGREVRTAGNLRIHLVKRTVSMPRRTNTTTRPKKDAHVVEEIIQVANMYTDLSAANRWLDRAPSS